MTSDARPSIERVARLAMVTADIDAAVEMFRSLDFEISMRRRLPETYADLLGVPGARIEEAMLRLGAQDISLLTFDPPGRPYPAGSTSTDLWFQHFAIIVSDMGEACERLAAYGRFQPISENGPETLPPASGSVVAFKFRDAEGHPLEFLAFPAEGAPEPWAKRRAAGGLFLGIDHSAVAVADTAASAAFFERAFGLRVGQRSLNVGPEQSRMDDVPDARVTVTGLMPKSAPPHVELLGYHVGERRPIDGATVANDLAATFFVLETASLDPVVEALTAIHARFVSPGVVALEPHARAVMVLDPDGHRFCIVERG